MNCPIETGRDVAEAYVAGSLPDAEQEAFEQHFFTCAACLAQVQLLQDVRDRLASVPAVPRAPDPRWQAAPWLGLALAAGLVAAVSWWWQGGTTQRAGTSPPAAASRTGPAAPSAAPAPPPAPAPDPPVEAPGRRAVLAQLAMVVPPRYVPLAVRGETPAAGSFDAAMAHYVAGRHDEAAGALQILSEEKPADPGIAFFWGISELVVGHADDAREGLSRAIAAGVQPYADEAHFYLAKVYLAEDQVDLAKMELRYAIEHGAGPEGEARRLLQALEQLPK
jgi:hypothetical protein